MNDTIIRHMQAAVDAIAGAEHATSKVAACVFDPASASFAASPSRRPACLHDHFAWNARLGASSQFIHAELAALLAFKGSWREAHLCVTDPFCPNCAKMMAEAGVRSIYIDHKGFEKDFIARNGDEFKAMSMLIAEKAGMNVYEVNRKAGTVTPILAQAMRTRPAPSAIEFYDIDAGLTLEGAMESFRTRLGARETWATALVREADGNQRGILVFEALPPGITPDDFTARCGVPTGKYRFPVDPLTRLLITVRRMGMTLLDGNIGCARAPSSRALVNMLGFQVNNLTLASVLPDHDSEGFLALEALAQRKLVTFKVLP